MTKENYDVIVLGVGSMGSSACYHLAKRGCRVLGLEQFEIPHEHGSHTGQSRIIRKAYGEDPDYVPLLHRAYENWKTLERETDSKLFHQTGLLYFGPPQDTFLETVKVSSSKYHIPVHQLSEKECSAKYPQFNVPAHFQRMEEPDAGFLTPDRCIITMVSEAIRMKAIMQTGEKVMEWKRVKGKITVRTDKNTYTADKLVITAGPWAGKMIPGFDLKVVRQVIAWMKPKNWETFAYGNFPCWIIQDETGFGYGFPVLPGEKFGGPRGLKFAFHQVIGEAVDPDAVNRDISESEKQALIDFLTKYIPDACESILSLKTCLYTNTSDLNFIMDHLPGYDKDVTIAAGFSGHGFKFASVIGEILADLTINGTTDLPIDFLRADRFV